MDRLLSPRRRKSTQECQCKRVPSFSDQEGLETIIQVTTSTRSNPVSIFIASPPFGGLSCVKSSTVRKSRCTSKNALKVVNGRQDTGPTRGPDLPPLLDPERMVPPSNDPPRFTAPVPLIKYVVSLTGTRCSCFFECAFPGCIRHHVPPSSTGTTKELSSPRSAPTAGLTASTV